MASNNRQFQLIHLLYVILRLLFTIRLMSKSIVATNDKQNERRKTTTLQTLWRLFCLDMIEIQP